MFLRMKTIFCLVLILGFVLPVSASVNFTQAEIDRLLKAKALLKNNETRSTEEIIDEFEKSGSPQQHLLIYEAIATTFNDILHDYGAETPNAEEQLLGKIRMNMAFFQLGGSRSEQTHMNELNRLIRRKLKQYLPGEIWDNPELFHSLE